LSKFIGARQKITKNNTLTQNVQSTLAQNVQSTLAHNVQNTSDQYTINNSKHLHKQGIVLLNNLTAKPIVSFSYRLLFKLIQFSLGIFALITIYSIIINVITEIDTFYDPIASLSEQIMDYINVLTKSIFAPIEPNPHEETLSVPYEEPKKVFVNAVLTFLIIILINILLPIIVLRNNLLHFLHGILAWLFNLGAWMWNATIACGNKIADSIIGAMCYLGRFFGGGDAGPGPAPAPIVEPNVGPIVEPNVEPNVGPIVEPNVGPIVEPNVGPIVEPNVEPNIGLNVGGLQMPQANPFVVGSFGIGALAMYTGTFNSLDGLIFPETVSNLWAYYEHMREEQLLANASAHVFEAINRLERLPSEGQSTFANSKS
jgi:hypothetical protein